MNQKESQKLFATFFGGTNEVTGSRHLIETPNQHLLLDFGLFQGHRLDALRKNQELPKQIKKIENIVLSHAHIDHCGGLPILAKNNWPGIIHATKATQDLCQVMLMDSAFLQEEDAKFFNKIHRNDEHIEPLYTKNDAEKILRQFRGHFYNKAVHLDQNLSLDFHNAGHVLGSSMIEISVVMGPKKRRLLFTGDLGRSRPLLMKPPKAPEHIDTLIIESTYGGRRHASMAKAEKTLIDVWKRAHQERSKILIPSFALERTQEVVLTLHKLSIQGLIPKIPIIVDSPMAVEITKIFNKYRKNLSWPKEIYPIKKFNEEPFAFDNVRYVRHPEESKAINDEPGPLAIISASGMCEGGRILHHLRNNIGSSETTIVLVGFQAEGTLGHRLAQGASKVKIFGLEHEVLAQVEKIDAFSSHADQDEIVNFIQSFKPLPKNIFLVHGDPNNRRELAVKLNSLGIWRVHLPEPGQRIPL